MKTKESASERVFKKYQYLSEKTARKINVGISSYELEDLIQEFNMKLWSSIKAYGRKYLAYRRGEEPKPVPLKYYLQSVIANKAKDMMKYLSRTSSNLRIDDVSYDYGMVDETRIIPEKNTFIVKDVNLLEGLQGIDKAVFSMYLRGYNTSVIKKISGDANQIIKRQKKYIADTYESELLTKNRIFSSYCLED